DLGGAHLRSIARFGGGALIGGARGLIVKLAPPGDATWNERANAFGEARLLDEVFAAGPEGFINHGLAAYLDAVGAAGDDDGEPAGHNGNGNGNGNGSGGAHRANGNGGAPGGDLADEPPDELADDVADHGIDDPEALALL